MKDVRGFTLLELLIVIAIIAILSAVLIFVLNPAQILRQGRDSQRLSDLRTLNRAISLYVTTVKNPDLDDEGTNPSCEDIAPTGLIGGKIWLSGPAVQGSFAIANPSPNSEDGQNLHHPDPTGGWITGSGWWFFLGASLPGSPPNPNRGTGGINPANRGWIFVDFTDIPGGSPVSILPIDPLNKLFYDPVGNASYIRHLALGQYDANDGFYYRFTCKEKTTGYVCGGTTWEFNANMESDRYRERERTDGGDWDFLYEAGTCLQLLPAADGCPKFGAGFGCW